MDGGISFCDLAGTIEVVHVGRYPEECQYEKITASTVAIAHLRPWCDTYYNVVYITNQVTQLEDHSRTITIHRSYLYAYIVI